MQATLSPHHYVVTTLIHNKIALLDNMTMPQNKFFMHLHNPDIDSPQGNISNWHCKRNRSAPPLFTYSRHTVEIREWRSPLRSGFRNVIVSEENL